MAKFFITAGLTVLSLTLGLIVAPPARAQDVVCTGLLRPLADQNGMQIHYGNVIVPSGATCRLSDNWVENVQVKPGGILISTEGFINNIDADGARGIWIGSDSVIRGSVLIKKTVSPPAAFHVGDPNLVFNSRVNVICATVIRGNVQIEENGQNAPSVIGDAPYELGNGAIAACGGVRIGGDLHVFKNQGKVEVSGVEISRIP